MFAFLFREFKLFRRRTFLSSGVLVYDKVLPSDVIFLDRSPRVHGYLSGSTALCLNLIYKEHMIEACHFGNEGNVRTHVVAIAIIVIIRVIHILVLRKCDLDEARTRNRFGLLISNVFESIPPFFCSG